MVWTDQAPACSGRGISVNASSNGPDQRPPSKRLRGAVTQRIAAGPGPKQRLRARRYGTDRLLGRSPELELYFEPGDPHSHLCAQLLPALQKRLRTPIRVHVVPAPTSTLYQEAGKQRDFALRDAVRIAPAWGLEFPADAVLPTGAAREAAAAALAGVEDTAAFLERERALAEWLWRNEAPKNHTLSPAQRTALA